MLLWQRSRAGSPLFADEGQEPPRNQSPVGSCPLRSMLVLSQILAGRGRVVWQATGAKAVDVVSQHGFADSPRTAVNQQHEPVFLQPEVSHGGRDFDFVNHLQLCEMVAAADGAQAAVEHRWRDPGLGQWFAEVAIPGVFEAAKLSDPAVQFQFSRQQARLPQRHATANVVASQVRIDEAADGDDRTNGRALARMEIGHTDRSQYPGQLDNSLELRNCLPDYPVLLGRYDPYGRTVVRFTVRN